MILTRNSDFFITLWWLLFFLKLTSSLAFLLVWNFTMVQWIYRIITSCFKINSTVFPKSIDWNSSYPINGKKKVTPTLLVSVLFFHPLISAWHHYWLCSWSDDSWSYWRRIEWKKKNELFSLSECCSTLLLNHVPIFCKIFLLSFSRYSIADWTIWR